MNALLSKRQTRKAVEKLAPESGNVLVVRSRSKGPQDTEAARQMAQSIADFLHHNGVDVGMIVCGPDDKISVMDEAGMARAGWISAARCSDAVQRARATAREACAVIAERERHAWGYVLAAKIRAQSSPLTSGAGSDIGQTEAASCHPPSA